MLNLRQVQLFVLAAERGSMTAAAAEQSLSQSAVSLAVRALEDQLGTQLFVRRPARGLSLTAAGARFLPQARDLLVRAEEVELEAQAEGHELRGELTVGCFRTAAPFILPGLIETFSRRHPEVTVNFIEGPSPELELALLEGHCELALLYDLDVGDGIHCERLCAMESYVLLSAEHPYARLDSVALEQVADLDLILLDVPPSSAHVLGLLTRAGLTPRVRYRVSSLELVRSLVARNLGYALLISRPAGDLSYEGRAVRAVAITDHLPATSFSVAWPAGMRQTPRARAFVDHCRETIPQSISPAATSQPLSA